MSSQIGNIHMGVAEFFVRLLISSIFSFIVLCGLRKLTRNIVLTLSVSKNIKDKYLRYNIWTYGIFLAPSIGIFGVRFTYLFSILMFSGFFILQVFLIYLFLGQEEKRRMFTSYGWLAFLFLISGFAALVYQIAWQRVLFSIYGVNIESVTIIVSIFMFGLGVGAISGGLISRFYGHVLPELFLTCEVLIAIFGSISVPLIKSVGLHTLQHHVMATSLFVYLLLCFPTMLMGATLPILVTYLYQNYRNIGKSVGILYSMNTAGSAIACFMTIDVLFRLFGIQSAVHTAVICNLATGFLVYRYTRDIKKNDR
jgi:hypothetical protein